jgi:hypothetical protein
MKRAYVDNSNPKTFRVMLGDHEIGVSKTDFDARFHVNAINDALDEAYLSEDVLLQQEDKAEPDAWRQKGGRCKKCGGLTMYTRQDSVKGECFACEFQIRRQQ